MVLFGQDPKPPVDLRLLVRVERIDLLQLPVQLKENRYLYFEQTCCHEVRQSSQ